MERKAKDAIELLHLLCGNSEECKYKPRTPKQKQCEGQMTLFNI